MENCPNLQTLVRFHVVTKSFAYLIRPKHHQKVLTTKRGATQAPVRVSSWSSVLSVGWPAHMRDLTIPGPAAILFEATGRRSAATQSSVEEATDVDTKSFGFVYRDHGIQIFTALNTLHSDAHHAIHLITQSCPPFACHGHRFLCLRPPEVCRVYITRPQDTRSVVYRLPSPAIN